MFFNQNGILNIDEAIMNKESFKKIMADGTVTEDYMNFQLLMCTAYVSPRNWWALTPPSHPYH